MKKPNKLHNSAMLLLILVLSGCASKRPAPYQPPQIPALPPEIIEERHQPSLTEKLLKLLSP